MLISNNIEIINNKKFPIRIYGNIKSKYIYILNHGMISSKESFRPLEAIGGDKYLFVSFDARANEGSDLVPSRYVHKYIDDMRDIVVWTKEKYPNKKIVMLGSSWGASNSLLFAKKYGNLVYRSVGWSIPHKISGSGQEDFNIKEVEEKEEEKVRTSAWLLLWKFFVMIITNINTHVRIKIDYKKTADNKLLARLGKLKKYNVVSTRYIWAVRSSLGKSIRAIKWLNIHGNNNALYIQSSLDLFSTKRKMKFLSKNTNKNVNYLLCKEFFHACHWEKTNNINRRMFFAVTQWVEKNKLEFPPPATIATHTNRKLDFSFMVAAYNVGDRVKRCVDSILQNKSNNYEIILVDDASTDDTLSYINEYKNNKKVKIIQHPKNGGCSKGRDTGIKNAKGEWFVFVDSDDYISPNFIDNIKLHLNDNHNLYIFRRDKDKMARKMDDAIQKYKRDCCVTSRVWNHTVFNNYDFPYKYRRGLEDWDFHVRRWETFKIKNIIGVDDIYYYYTYNSKSLTKSPYVFRTRLTQAIDIYSNEETRRVALKYHIYEHYYLHLLIMATVWFPDLFDDVKKLKYKQKVPIKVRIQYFFCLMPGFRTLARNARKINNE